MNKKDKINRMTSDEEDVIFIGETKVANSGTRCSSKEQNDSEKQDTKENTVVLSKIVMREAALENFMYIKKRIKRSAPRVVTTKSHLSSGSDVKSLDQSLNKRHNTCIMCGEMFERYADIKAHLIQAHSYRKQSQCDICGELFSDPKQLEIHKQVHKEAATTTSSSALLCELDRHSVDVTKVNTVKLVQEKPPESEVTAENVNKENEGSLENTVKLVQEKPPKSEVNVENVNKENKASLENTVKLVQEKPPESEVNAENVNKENEGSLENTVKLVQAKLPKSEVNAENVNKENKASLENVKNSAGNGIYVYKSKAENNTCTNNKIKISLPFDKLYTCKICKKFVFKSYRKIHEKIHSSKSACSLSSSTERGKIFGPVQVHHAMNKNIGHSAKGMTPDNTVLKQTCQENETRSVDNNISNENMATALPHIDVVRHATNIETQSRLLHAKTLQAVSVNPVNLGESSSLTKRSEKMSWVSVATQNRPPCKQYERKTILLKKISNGIASSAHLNISAASQSQTVLHAIPPQTKINLPVSCMSLTTKVLASTSQNECVSQPTVLSIPCSQSNVALSVQNGSVYTPLTSVVAVLNGNAGLALPGVSGTSASVSFVALPRGVFASASQVSNTSHLSFIHLAPPREKVATVPKANLIIPLPSHPPLSNEVVSSQAEAVVEANTEVPLKANTEVPLKASTEIPLKANSEVPLKANTEIPLKANTEVPLEANTEIPLKANTEVPLEANTEAPLKVDTEVPHLSSYEVGNVAKQHENIKSSKSLTKMKIYSCPICKKGLSKGYVMQHMMRVHLGERPFKCEICHKAFAKKTSLSKHTAVKHVVKTGITNSENTVSFSGSNDLTVKGSGVCDDLNSPRRIAEQNECDKTNAMVSIPASNHWDAKADCKNAVSDRETSYYDPSASGYPESSNRTSEFEVVDAGIQTLKTEVCEKNEREEIASSCGRKSSLGDMTGLLHSVNDEVSNIQDVDMEIIEEFQVLSVENYKNAGQKRKLSDASLERPPQKCHRRRVHTSKLHKQRLRRICKLCDVIFYDKRNYRMHMLGKHSKHVSSRANVQCHHCGKLFMYVRSLKQHLILKHPKK